MLRALRSVDEPAPNAGVDVALRYVSADNPSSTVTREIFRSYLDDASYPYGILTRWTEMRPEEPLFFDDDDEDAVRRCTLDVELVDDAAHDGVEWTVAFELSKAPTQGWLIDRVWCERLS